MANLSWWERISGIILLVLFIFVFSVSIYHRFWGILFTPLLLFIGFLIILMFSKKGWELKTYQKILMILGLLIFLLAMYYFMFLAITFGGGP